MSVIKVVFYQKRPKVEADGSVTDEEYTVDAAIESWHNGPFGKLYMVRFSPVNAQLMDQESIEKFTRCAVNLNGLPRGYSI